MVIGRNTQTYSHMGSNNFKCLRNLNKNQLGGVIFGCTSTTMKECFAKQLFGLPAQHFSYVKNIEPGLPLFLFDYSERKLYGIYEAACSGRMSIDSYAWTTDGSDKTKFPAQVQISLRLQCQVLTEFQFKPIIIDNYYGQSHFWFELDHAQANKLMSKLSSLAIAPGTFIPQKSLKSKAVIKKEDIGLDDFVSSHESTSSSTASDNSISYIENNSQSDEKEHIFMKLKEPALGHEFPDASMSDDVELEHEKRGYDVELEHEKRGYDVASLEKENGGSSSDSHDSVIAQLCKEIEELKTFKQDQSVKIESLEKKMAKAEQEIHRLQSLCMKLESASNTLTGLSGDETQLESSSEADFNLKESILILGGYDGASWSSALHSFTPSHDILISLEPMSSVRSYASVASLNGELFVFGGGTRSTWYDTVECYNAANYEWTQCPSLSKGKGSLAGAALNGKIYAVGGGNGVDCFSDVEMFDPNVGRWISARSMIEKRFALAAAELNGALYAVGGYDGFDYLMSAERFDPREHTWTKIKSMDAKRGCLSLVAMNQKLYALGGYDGTTMVPTVEIYDPRLGVWMPGEPMSQARGYSAAAVLKDTIYVIGGVQGDKDIVDKVEVYKEGQGWEATNSRAVGKRCFASSIVLGED